MLNIEIELKKVGRNNWILIIYQVTLNCYFIATDVKLIGCVN